MRMLPAQALATRLSRLHGWRGALLVAVVAAIGIGFVSSYLYRLARQDAQADLSVIVELKTGEIERWLDEKRSGMIQPPAGALATALAEWQSSHRDQQANTRLRSKLAFYLQRHPEASRITMYDIQGTPILGTDPEQLAQPPQLTMPSPRQETLAWLIDFYPSKAGPRLAFATPLRMNEADDAAIIGFVLLEVDPQKYLYPFIQAWPGTSSSAETMLYRRLGNEIEYLSPQPRESIAALQKRHATRPEISVPREQHYRTYASTGTDAMGRGILRVTHPIKGTNWWLAAQITEAEFYAPALRDSIVFSVILLALLFAVFRLFQLSHLRSLADVRHLQEAQDMALLRAFIDAVPETLYMLRRDATLVMINRTGAERFSASQETLIGSKIFAHMPTELAANCQSIMESAWASGEAAIFEDSHAGADYLNHICPLPDGQHLAVIATDITRRNADARALRESAQTLQRFIDHLPGLAYVKDHETRVLVANRQFGSLLGVTPASMIGKLTCEVFPGLVGEKFAADDLRILTAGRTEVIEEQVGERVFETTKFLIPHEYGPPALGGITLDITARYQAEQALRQSEERLRTLGDNLPESFIYQVIVEPDGQRRFLYVSSGVERIPGVTPEIVLADSQAIYGLVDPSQLQNLLDAENRCLETMSDFATEVRVRRTDDTWGWLRLRSRPHRDATGSIVWDGIATDITERHQIEAALRKSEERLRALGDNLPASVLYQTAELADGSRQLLYASSSAERLLGVSAQALAKDIENFYARVDPIQIPSLRTALASSLGDLDIDLRILRGDDTWGWVNLHARRQADKDDQGRFIWNGVATDVSAKHQADEILALQARIANTLLDLPRQAEMLTETQFMAHALEMAEQLTGSQIAFVHFVHEDQEGIELVAWSSNTLAHYCHASYDRHYPISAAGIWADAARKRQPVIVNDYANCPDKHGLPEGHSPLQRLISVPVIDGGKVRMLAGVGNKKEDYTALDLETVQLIANQAWRIVHKQRVEHLLKQTQQVVEASPAVCFRWRPTPGWPITFVSDNLRRWGYDPDSLLASASPFADLIHPDDLARVSAEVADHLARQQNEYTQEYRLISPDGRSFWVTDAAKVIRDESGTVRFIDGVLSDISERKAHEIRLAEKLAAEQALNKRLEEAHNQLLQAEKLAAIGQLAAGVAHELNNPIGFVHSNLGTLSEYATTLVELCDGYAILLEDQRIDSPRALEIQRIKESQDYNFLRADIFPLLDESREGLIRMRKIVQDLRDFSRTGSQEWSVADVHRGLDSTLNIIANELKYKCTVRKEYGQIPEIYCVISQINQVFMNLLVNAAQAIPEKGEIVICSGMEDNAHIWVSISDTGQGIPPELMNRIFDPFFTTKPVGIGTGLGLSLVFSIVTRHGGRIDVTSEPGKGTTFRIVLPIQPAEKTHNLPQEAS